MNDEVRMTKTFWYWRFLKDTSLCGVPGVWTLGIGIYSGVIIPVPERERLEKVATFVQLLTCMKRLALKALFHD